jgi:molybdopterin-biosynthesis enzyme MoeA-like protein
VNRFGLIVIGDEILSGKRADKHLPKVVELLKARGLSLSWARYLGDERDAITAALRDTFSGGDVVFSTGGIGATPDDHTRQAAAAALGRGLHLHPTAERLIGERIAEMSPQGLSAAETLQRMRMGEFPQGCSIIPNPYNKIPGFSVERHYFVPGFPVMAWPMLEWVLDEYFSAEFHQLAQRERSLIVFGSAEATLTPLMEHIERDFPGIRVFSLPSVGDDAESGPRSRRHIELGVKGVDQARVDAAYAVLRDAAFELKLEIDESAQ